MTPEFTHCALHVCDLGQSITFYQSYCGLGIVKEHGQGNTRTVWRMEMMTVSCSCCLAEDLIVRRSRTT
jgi:hypothetical protein